MKKNVKTNFLLQLLYQIVVLGMPLILSPYLTRVLGGEKLGVYSYVYSICTIFVTIAMLGIYTYGCRLIASAENLDDRRKKFYSLFFVHLVLGIVVILVYFFYVLFFVTEHSIIYLILGMYVLSSLFDITWYFHGLEEFKHVILKNIFIKLLEIILVLLLVKNTDGLIVYSLIMSIGILISQLLLWPRALVENKFYFPKINEMVEHVRPLLILSISVIAVNVYCTFDKTLIGMFINDNKESVAFYDYAEKLVKLPINVCAVVGVVLLPNISNLIKENHMDEVKKKLSKSSLFLSFITSATCFGLIAVADNLIPLYYGEEFAICADYVKLLSPLIIIIPFGATFRNTYMIPANKDKQYVFSLVLGAIINLIVNFILIPLIGVNGAIIGTLCAELIAMILQCFFVKKELPLKEYFTQLIWFVLFGAIMYGLIHIVNLFIILDPVYVVIIDIVIGAVFYLIVSYIFIYITKKDVLRECFDYIKDIFKIKKKEDK